MMIKPLIEMTPDEIREEIKLLRERRLVARQQSVEDNKPKVKQPRTAKSKVEEVDSELGNLIDMLTSGDGGISESNFDIMMKNLGEL